MELAGDHRAIWDRARNSWPGLLKIASIVRSPAGISNARGFLPPRHEMCPMRNAHEQAEAYAIADIAKRLWLDTFESESLSALYLSHLIVGRRNVNFTADIGFNEDRTRRKNTRRAQGDIHE
jgi:hypothetical protein